MADYSINAVSRKVSYTGSAGLGPYVFSFEILDDDDIAVYLNETLLTKTTDYTVTINVNGTGSVTLVTGGEIAVAPTASDLVVILGARDIERTTDFVTAGDLRASALNEQLDALTIFMQQIKEEVDRSVKAPAFDPTGIDMVLPKKADRVNAFIAFDANGDVSAAVPSDDVTTLAEVATDIATLADIEDGTIATDAISDTAAIASDVTTVAGIAANVTTVAGNTSNINAVAADATDIGTVAANIADVSAVAAIDTQVSAVAADATDIGTVATDLAGTDTIGTVAGIAADVSAVAAIDTDVSAVAGISADVTAVAGDATDIGTVSTNIANVNTVAGVSANVTTVAGISANVTTVAGIAADVSTVAADGTDIGVVAGISADVSAVAAIDSDVTIAATNVADITNFADVYQGAKASAPTLRNDGSALQTGDLYFDTVLDQMRVFDGSSFIAVGSSVNGTAQRYKYTATAAQTSFSGTDDNGVTLAYDAGYIDVYLNGVHLDPSDYTATSGTSIVLDVGAALDDELYIVAFGNFQVADTVSKSLGGTFDGPITIDSTLDVDDDVTVGGNVLYVDVDGKRVSVNTTTSRGAFDVWTSRQDGMVANAAEFINPTPNVPGSGAGIRFSSTIQEGRNAGINGIVTDGLNGHSLDFLTNKQFQAPTTKMRVTPDGTVGIGTLTPAATLDVDGDVIIRDDLQFNSGYGSVATAYGCRAWVNFNGTGTVAIREDGNVSSITDNGTGDYTVNFTSAMSDVNYSMVTCSTKDAGQSLPRHVLYDGGTKTTSAIKLIVETDNGDNFDNSDIYIAIFR